jgi:filamentous hemagglutinin family protein
MTSDPTRRRSPWLRLALLAGTALVSAAAAADELPRGPSVVHGKVGVSASGDRMTIRQGSRKAIVNWRGFSIGPEARVRVRQPSRKSAMLNRVTGSTPSSIAGRLEADGQVYLVNPNGVLIGRSGVVRAGGFVASTLDIADRDFRDGRAAFAGHGASAAVANEGVIGIGRGGYAALLGGAVENAGTISVPLGRAGLAAGERVTLDFSGDRFLQVEAPTLGGPEGALVDNAGVVSADGGRVEIRAAVARRAARDAINLSGVVEARTVAGVNGAIVLGGNGGRVAVSGRLDASAPRRPEGLRLADPPRPRPRIGGAVIVTGPEIALTGARIDAGGHDGGGAIRIGGDVQGRGGLPRSRLTEVDAATTLAADALGRGDGGSVVVWSDADARFAGRISARGGPKGGDGGFAEVSGKARLAFAGAADLSAARGAVGMLLLDPFDVTIADAPGSGEEPGDPPTSDDWVVDAAALTTALASADVTVTTGAEDPGDQDGDITVAAPLSWQSEFTLTLDAFADISIENAIEAPEGGLTLTASGEILTPNDLGAIDVGTFIVTAGDWVQTGPALPPFEATDFRIVEGTFLRAAGGDGGAAAPYQIVDAYGLQGIGTSLELLDSDFVLANDIDATGTAGWNNFEDSEGGIDGFDPIGFSEELAFNGTFDGAGFTIEGLFVDRPFDGLVGLFAATGADAVVQNVDLAGVDLTGGGLVGGVAGLNAGLIEQASVTGTVASDGSFFELSDVAAGGIAGENDGTIVDSFSEAAVTAIGSPGGLVFAGGLAGTSAGTITNAFASGAVSGDADTGSVFAGGLVGTLAEGGSITGAYASGAVDADGAESSFFTGGLVGENFGSILQAYATGDVDHPGGGNIGGLVGTNFGSIDQTYATGLVFGGVSVDGGLIGVNSGGTAESSFWDIVSTGQPTSDGDLGVGLTTDAFQDTADFTAAAEAAGWDFETTWAPPTDGFYPELYALSSVVSVFVDDATRAYGSDNPPFTATTFGGPDSYVFGPVDDVLDVGAALSSPATAASDVGAYAISGDAEAISEGGETYRLIILEDGVLTVDPAPLVVAADDAARSYGEANPDFTASFTGFVLGQDAGVLDGALAFATDATAESDVDDYAVTPSGLASGNYAISYEPGVLTVDPAPLTIVADDLSKPFGTILVFRGDEFTAEGLVNDDTVRSVQLASEGAAAEASAAGSPYAILASEAEGAGLGSYDIVYAPGALTVLPADEPEVVEATPPASRLPAPPLPQLERTLSVVFTDEPAAAAASGGPTLGTGAPGLAAAEATLGFVLRVSRDLEVAVQACETAGLAFDGYLACLRDGLDAYGDSLDARILDLPEPLRVASAVIEQAARRIETARATAAERLRTARTPEEIRAVETAAVAEAQAAVGVAVEEIRKAIELIRADEPELARLQGEQGVAIAAALETVELGLTRAVGL